MCSTCKLTEAEQMVEERIPEGGAIEDTAELPAEEYSEHMKKRLGREYRKFVNHILNSHLNPPTNAKCLEIGPGPGWIGIWLAEKRPDLQTIGLEPSPDMRRVAKANAESCGVHQRIEFVPGYAENLERFSDGEFDLCSLTSHCITGLILNEPSWRRKEF